MSRGWLSLQLAPRMMKWVVKSGMCMPRLVARRGRNLWVLPGQVVKGDQQHQHAIYILGILSLKPAAHEATFPAHCKQPAYWKQLVARRTRGNSEVQGHSRLRLRLDVMTESQSSYNIFHLNELMKLFKLANNLHSIKNNLKFQIGSVH
jgi:hypothetical protein